MPRPKKLDAGLVLSTYRKKGCNLTATADTLGMTRTKLLKAIEADPDLKAKIDDAREMMLDFAESKLFEMISQGNKTATIFFLKCQGKKRGYIERQETEITVNPFQDLIKSLPDE